MTMDPGQQKQQFSYAVVKAIAAAAGISWSVPSVDDDSIDLAFSSRALGRPRLESQIKCTEVDHVQPDGLHYSLPRKNYEELRLENIVVPRILIVVLVPRAVGEWLTFREDEMILRRCAWWMSLCGQPAMGAVAAGSKTVVFPSAQRFTPEALIRLLTPRGAL